MLENLHFKVVFLLLALLVLLFTIYCKREVISKLNSKQSIISFNNFD